MSNADQANLDGDATGDACDLCTDADDLVRAKWLGDNRNVSRGKINNDVAGLGLEDTIVHYETKNGLTYVEPSNRVCVYAPRFGAVRKVTTAITGENIIATQRVDLPHGPIGIDRRQPSSAVMAPVRPERNTVADGPDAIETAASQLKTSFNLCSPKTSSRCSQT